MYALATILHVLAAVLWVGGMFFAWWILRPVAGEQLAPDARIRLWSAVFARFFPWVWGSIVVILITGFWMLFGVLGGFAGVHWSVHLMLLLGVVMMLLFAHIFFAPYKRLRRADGLGDLETGLAALGQLRLFFAINLVLGVVTFAVASGGRLIG